MSTPTFYEEFRALHPEVARAYDALAESSRAAGPLDPRTAEVVKLALAAGARLESAMRSHARRALAAGSAPAELRHVALLAITTLGFPTAMVTRAVIEDVLGEQAARR